MAWQLQNTMTGTAPASAAPLLAFSPGPRLVVYMIGMASAAQAWAIAMYRDVERGLGVLDPLLNASLGVFTLPALIVLSRLVGRFGDWSLPLIVLSALYLIAALCWLFIQPVRVSKRA